KRQMHLHILRLDDSDMLQVEPFERQRTPNLSHKRNTVSVTKPSSASLGAHHISAIETDKVSSSENFKIAQKNDRIASSSRGKPYTFDWAKLKQPKTDFIKARHDDHKRAGPLAGNCSTSKPVQAFPQINAELWSAKQRGQTLALFYGPNAHSLAQDSVAHKS